MLNKMFVYCMLFSFTVILSSCKKNETTIDDLAVDGLKEAVINNKNKSEEVQERAKLAINYWDNQRVDDCPILIEAELKKGKVSGDIIIFYGYYDEDKDILGFVIEEKIVEDHNLIYSEKFPIFEKVALEYPVEYGMISIIPREENEVGKKVGIPITIYDDNVDVYISLYDKDDNYSNTIKLNKL